ncbi:MAG: protein kinase [Gemmatimonadota bacterium]|nr:protein kinase [Gemmatimonadota bacterium]
MPTIADRLSDALGDRYEIGRELGHGGMAIVYLAQDRKHGREVAIKVLQPELAATVGAERFLREIEMAARIRHPHIVPLYDSGDAGGLLYYVMPFLGGESLRTRLDRDKQWPIDDAVRIANEVAEALSHAHAQGVVHRDIKPENIMLEAGHAVVADFGIAKAVSAPGGGITETGLSVGTPSYISPEQASGDANVDGRADLYSLACVLYEMLAGRPPFVGPTAASVIQQHLTLEPVPLTSLRPAVPGGISVAVHRALAKAPTDRFTTVAQFAEALRLPTATRPPAAPPGASARRIPWRPRWLVAAGIVVIAAAAAWAARDMLGVGRQRIDSLAVLPLDNLSGDPGEEYFVNGVHDALIGELSKISGLNVVSRTSVMSYRGTTKRTPEIAAELHTDGLIEGSVIRSGNTVRIQIQLIDARQDRHIWSRTYDRDVTNVLSAMGEVAGTIAGEVRVALTSQEVAHLAAGRGVDPVAQEHYLRGRDLVYRRDSASLPTAIAELKEAIRRDPSYASPYASLAFAYVYAANGGVFPESSYVWHARALAAASRAVALDSLNPEGYAVRGYQGLYTGAPADSTELVLRRAIALRPNYAEAWGWLAQAIAVGQPRLAIAAMDSALRLDPSAAGMQMARFVVGYLVDSAALVHEAAGPLVQLRPDLVPPVPFDGIALVELGRPAECLALSGLPPSVRAMCLHASGRQAEAVRLLRSELAALQAGHHGMSATFVPIALANIGQLDGALAALRALMAVTPGITLPVPGHRLFRSRADPAGVTFLRAARVARAQAWERVAREARTVTLP